MKPGSARRIIEAPAHAGRRCLRFVDHGGVVPVEDVEQLADGDQRESLFEEIGNGLVHGLHGGGADIMHENDVVIDQKHALWFLSVPCTSSGRSEYTGHRQLIPRILSRYAG